MLEMLELLLPTRTRVEIKFYLGCRVSGMVLFSICRRFYAKDLEQIRYNSYEIGKTLANHVVNGFEAGGSFWDRKSEEEEPWSDTYGEIPKFRKPLETKCTLINGI